MSSKCKPCAGSQSSIEIWQLLTEFMSVITPEQSEDERMVASIFEVALREFRSITLAGCSNQEVLFKAAKTYYLSMRLRVVPTELLCDLLQDECSEEVIQRVDKRRQTIERYLLNFQPTIYQRVHDHFLAAGALDVTYTAKAKGKQEGTIAHVMNATGGTERYFVKTYRCMEFDYADWSNFNQIDLLQHLDYKELVVYRVLDLLGVGPKVQFIVASHDSLPKTDPSETGILIATRDIAQCVSPPLSECVFRTFEAIVHDACKDVQHNEFVDKEQITRCEALLMDKLSTPIAKYDLKYIHMVCCLLHLHDVFENHGNFGQLVSADGETECRWKMVDFTVGVGKRHRLCNSPGSYFNSTIREDCEAKEWVSYECNRVLQAALMQSQEVNRAVRYEIIHGHGVVPPLETILRTAQDEVLALIEANKVMLCVEETLHRKKVLDLELYVAGVIQNIGLLEL